MQSFNRWNSNNKEVSFGCIFFCTADQNSRSTGGCVVSVCFGSSCGLCVCVCSHLDLKREVVTDGGQQSLSGLLSAHEHQLQIHVIFNQEAFGHQTDPYDATQHPSFTGTATTAAVLAEATHNINVIWINDVQYADPINQKQLLLRNLSIFPACTHFVLPSGDSSALASVAASVASSAVSSAVSSCVLDEFGWFDWLAWVWSIQSDTCFRARSTVETRLCTASRASEEG